MERLPGKLVVMGRPTHPQRPGLRPHLQQWRLWAQPWSREREIGPLARGRAAEGNQVLFIDASPRWFGEGGEKHAPGTPSALASDLGVRGLIGAHFVPKASLRKSSRIQMLALLT